MLEWFLGQVFDDNGDPRYFLTTDGEAVTRDLNDPATTTLYYLLRTTPGNTVTQKATLKPGPRVPSGNLEIAETVANGLDVASAEVKV